MDDLSVSSFADLGMYKADSYLEDVVRKKQPVIYGPPNQRGRRPGIKDKYPWEENKITSYSISMPAGYVTEFISKKTVGQKACKIPDLLENDMDTDKFKKVPNGIGLREQLMGDFSPRPVRIKGRPRKESTREDVNCEGEKASFAVEENNQLCDMNVEKDMETCVASKDQGICKFAFFNAF